MPQARSSKKEESEEAAATAVVAPEKEDVTDNVSSDVKTDNSDDAFIKVADIKAATWAENKLNQLENVVIKSEEDSEVVTMFDEEEDVELKVKSTLKEHYGFWVSSGASEFAKSVIREGYIPKLDEMPNKYIEPNNKSYNLNRDWENLAVKKLVRAGIAVQVSKEQLACINPLSVAVRRGHVVPEAARQQGRGDGGHQGSGRQLRRGERRPEGRAGEAEPAEGQHAQRQDRGGDGGQGGRREQGPREGLRRVEGGHGRPLRQARQGGPRPLRRAARQVVGDLRLQVIRHSQHSLLISLLMLIFFTKHISPIWVL